MSTFSVNVDTPPNEVFSSVQRCIGKADYKVQNVIPNQSIIAEGKRDFSWAIVIVLAILLWPAAIVYYFTRQRSSVTATITKNGEFGSTLNVTSNGKSSELLMSSIKDLFHGKSMNDFT